jgi:hypothetical protein
MITNKLMNEMTGLLPKCCDWETDYYRFEVFGKGVYFKKVYNQDVYVKWVFSKSYA